MIKIMIDHTKFLIIMGMIQPSLWISFDLGSDLIRLLHLFQLTFCLKKYGKRQKIDL